MKMMRKSHGKISDHFKGLGTVTRDTVVERAREIALINGRGPNHYNQDDFSEAKRELTGTEPDAGGEAEEETIAGLVTWDEPPGAAGHPVEKEETNKPAPRNSLRKAWRKPNMNKWWKAQKIRTTRNSGR